MALSRVNWASLLSETASRWVENKAMRLAAALSFYSALSIAPLLVLLLRVVGAVFGDEAATGEIEHQTRSLVGQDGAKAIQSMIASANEPTAGLIATVLSLVTLLFGASGVFAELQDSLNTIWKVQPKPNRGVLGIVRDRFLSFGMVLGMAFLLLVSLVISAGLSFVNTFLNFLPEGWDYVSQALNFLVSFGVITLLFGMMFKLLPDVKMAWADVWLGAAITSLLFAIGKVGIGVYLGQSSMASSYGVAGSFVVLLVWVYYSSLILFFGAELTKVYADQYGSRILPAKNAVPAPEAPVIPAIASTRPAALSPDPRHVPEAAEEMPAAPKPVPVPPGTQPPGVVQIPIDSPMQPR